MKIKKILSVVLAATMVCGLMLTGCGNKAEVPTEPTMNIKDVEKNGFQLEDYLTIETRGYNKYALIDAHFDRERFKEDCAKFLKEEVNTPALEDYYPGCKTPQEYLDALFKATYFDGLIDCESDVDKVSNGTTVHISMRVPDFLGDLLTVSVEDAMFEYKVKGLEDYDGIDPFKYVLLSYTDLVEVDGEIGYTLSSYASGPAELPNGARVTFPMVVAVEEGKVYKPSDTVHMTIDTSRIQNYEAEYGEGIYKATEMDVKLSDIMAYLPVGENARDIFTYMDEICLDNVDYATKKMMDSVTEAETSVERVGMMFYYDEDGKLFKENDKKFYNQLIFIYKITNEAQPNGWYSYMAYNGYMSVGYNLNYGTIELEKCTGDIFGSHMMDDYRYYHSEDERIYRASEAPMSFEENGVKYPGHLELADVFTAMKANMPWLEQYDHLIVTDAIAEFISEY